MRKIQLISNGCFIAAIILLLIAFVFALGPGHRYRVPMVDRTGTIDREIFHEKYKNNPDRAIYEIEMLIKNQERHITAVGGSSGFMMLSWIMLMAAYSMSVRELRNQRKQLSNLGELENQIMDITNSTSDA